MSSANVQPLARPDPYARRTRRDLPLLGEAQSLNGRILSSNTKTGWSVNLPIAETCHREQDRERKRRVREQADGRVSS